MFKCPICNRVSTNVSQHNCEHEVKNYINTLVSYPTKQNVEKLKNIASILSQLSLELPHINMLWVIDESVRLYTILWEINGKPPELKESLDKYTKLAYEIKKDPLVMSNLQCYVVYGASIFDIIKYILFHRKR